MATTVLDQTKPLEPGNRCGRWAFLRAFVLPAIAGGILIGLGLTTVIYFDIQDSTTAAVIVIVPGNAIMWLMMVKAMTRRLHDLGMSEWHLAWILPLLVVSPLFGSAGDTANLIRITGAIGFVLPVASLFASVAILTMVVWPGTNGPNRYGPPPT